MEGGRRRGRRTFLLLLGWVTILSGLLGTGSEALETGKVYDGGGNGQDPPNADESVGSEVPSTDDLLVHRLSCVNGGNCVNEVGTDEERNKKGVDEIIKRVKRQGGGVPGPYVLPVPYFNLFITQVTSTFTAESSKLPYKFNPADDFRAPEPGAENLPAPTQATLGKTHFRYLNDARMERRSFALKATDKYHFNPNDMFQLNVNLPGQKQPPWSYRGQDGVKSWHELQLEKFLVPLNPELGSNKDELLHRALLTDLADEEMASQDPRFYWALVRRMYIVPNTDFEWRVVERLFQTNDSAKWPRIYQNANGTKDNAQFVMDMPNQRALYHFNGSQNYQRGFYSSMRFLVPPRPDNATLQKHLFELDPAVRTNMPADSADYGALQEILEGFRQYLEGRFNPVDHEPSAEERDFFNNIFPPWITTVESMDQLLSGSPSPVIPPTNNTEEWLKLITRWMGTFKKYQEDTKRLQSRYSLPLFPQKFPICEHKEQSPLDINTVMAKSSSIAPYNFSFQGYNRYGFSIEVPADGTSLLQLSLDEAQVLEGNAVQLLGGATGGINLYFETMFIRFGNEAGKGSEHTINGKGADMELQLLFSYQGPDTSQPYYRTLARQLNDLYPYRGKLVIMLSVLVDAKDMEGDDPEALIFEPLAQVIYRFRKQSESAASKPGSVLYRKHQCQDRILRLIDFIPKNSVFYTYRGSLTFPPCFSHILWSVYERRLNISRKQLTEFRLFQTAGTEDDGFMAGNVRTADDIWVREENDPSITKSQRLQLKKERIEREVLRSLAGVRDLDDIYDYYYDHGRRCRVGFENLVVSQILIFLLAMM